MSSVNGTIIKEFFFHVLKNLKLVDKKIVPFYDITLHTFLLPFIIFFLSFFRHFNEMKEIKREDKTIKEAERNCYTQEHYFR
jgi:hypothetical protein